MRMEPGQPLSVSLSNAFIRVASPFVPSSQRTEWRQEWQAEIWHRWQFLRHTGEWNRREELRLVHNSLGAFADAFCLLTQALAPYLVPGEAVRDRTRELVRSPFACLLVLAFPLLVVALLSSGFPATRELLAGPSNGARGNLLYIWLHPTMGGGDKGMPPDLVPAWARHSRLLDSVTALSVAHKPVSIKETRNARVLVVTTEPKFFDILGAKPAVGIIPPARRRVAGDGIVLDHRAWVLLAHADPSIVGSTLHLDGTDYPVAGVLPAGFHFLSRQPTVYLVVHEVPTARVFALARLKPGVTESQLDHELTQIAQNVCYYFYQSQFRYGFWSSALLMPLQMFGLAVLVTGLLAAIVFRVRPKQVRVEASRRVLFFAAKTCLALAAIFTGCLEWSRSESAVLMASQDPASGPFLLWLYILGCMGVIFWAVADQRARCRVCLRLLAFPVRIGCPGCLLLDWSGTELLCSEGHGVLHVPHLAASWDAGSERWVSMDESWRDFFAHEK